MKKNYYPCTIKSKLIIFYFLSPNSEDTNVKLEQKNQTLKKKKNFEHQLSPLCLHRGCIFLKSS